MKSCYKSKAGFDHIFKIIWPNGRYVQFSAQSCQKKFRWITTLYNFKFDTNVKVSIGLLHATITSHAVSTAQRVLEYHGSCSITCQYVLSRVSCNNILMLQCSDYFKKIWFFFQLGSSLVVWFASRSFWSSTWPFPFPEIFFKGFSCRGFRMQLHQMSYPC